MKKNKFTLLFTAGSFLAFLLFTLLVKFVDVKAIGPQGSSVGLAFLNKPFMISVNSNFDGASDLILYLSAFIVFIVAIIGLTQFVSRGKLGKVDNNILAIPLTLFLTLLFIVAFEFVIINYRPVLEDGVLEASYPSTHTTIIFTALLITIPVFNNLAKNKYEQISVFVLYLTLGILALLFRMLSGVHYFTDIVGGILLALSMASCNKLFTSLLDKLLIK